MALAVASRIVGSVVWKAEKSMSWLCQQELSSPHHTILTGMVRLSAPTAVVTVGVLMIQDENLVSGKISVEND